MEIELSSLEVETGCQDINVLCHVLRVLQSLASSSEVRQKIREIKRLLILTLCLHGINYSGVLTLLGLSKQKTKTNLEDLLEQHESIKGKISDEMLSRPNLVIPDFRFLVIRFWDLLLEFLVRVTNLIKNFFTQDTRFSIFFYVCCNIPLQKRIKSVFDGYNPFLPFKMGE